MTLAKLRDNLKRLLCKLKYDVVVSSLIFLIPLQSKANPNSIKSLFHFIGDNNQ